jgi:tRNA dimethylallyltransferase
MSFPIVALVGPTAVGKTALALALAERLGPLEVVSADSRQIYRLMDIATAKPTLAERERVAHHLLDVVWPDEVYTLAHYQDAAMAALAEIHARGRLPLLVGGTGLYMRAVVDGLAIPEVAPDPAVRAELEAQLAREGVASLHARLAILDPLAAVRIDARNPRRLIRALEVCMVTGQPISAQQGTRATPYHTLSLGLTMDRAALFARAAARVDAMLEAGLVAETEALVARGYPWRLPSMSSLGYREIGAYLRGELTLAASIETLKRHTRDYIRRQQTWFRRDTRIRWLDASQSLPDLADEVATLIRAHR